MSFYIGHGSSDWPAAGVAEHFAVNLMDHGQEAVAALFARKGADRFGPRTRWCAGPGEIPEIRDQAAALAGLLTAAPPARQHPGSAA